MRHKLFIAGTDTGVGKTMVAEGLLHAAAENHMSTAALKPVAAGCEEHEGELCNEDALQLQSACTLDLAYGEINPVALKAAIAPHIAAQQEGRRVSVDRLAGFCQGVLSKGADLTVIEGAGGWRVPLNNREMLSDLAKQLNVPVLLVVGMRLGCLNHSLLSVEAILKDGLPLAGWVANQIDSDMSCYEENLQTLKSAIPAPCVGTIPFKENLEAKDSVDYFQMDLLINRLQELKK